MIMKRSVGLFYRCCILTGLTPGRVSVSVVNIREVRVPMREAGVHMRVGVRLDAAPLELMAVLMVLIVDVGMLVFQGLVSMKMFVMLAEMQPQSADHEQRGYAERQSEWFMQEHNGHQHTDEGCDREISAGARRAQLSQRHDEKTQTDSIAQKAHHEGAEDRRPKLR